MNLFGKFEILGKDLRISTEDIPAPMEFMIAYLCCNKGKCVSQEMMADLYGDESVSWKNQIYRFRKNVMTYTDINKENKEKNNIETTTITESATDRIVPATVSESCIIECGSDKLFNLTKELFAKYNLSDKDISEIISIAQSDFNKITKTHKVIVNYKKPISSIMGFLRNAIIKNWEPDDKSTTISSNNDTYLRYDCNSWEELEVAWQNKSAS